MPPTQLRLPVALACCLLTLRLVSPTAAAADQDRPNLLVIITDQQHAGMMSVAGNEYLKTPAMDALAAAGCRFERAYATNPVCVPARVSMMTGKMPSHFGMRTNGDSRKGIEPTDLEQCLGWIFARGGYQAVHGGKTHWLKGMTPTSIGFELLTMDQRDGLADACVDFLGREHEQPFLLVASFINPHDICYMAIDAEAASLRKRPVVPRGHAARQCLARALELPEGISRETFFEKVCPPLPSNFEVPEREPECITTAYLGARSFRQHARDTWSDETWRMHRWAYCQLTEMVDAQIGRVLDALQASDSQDRTVVVFTSDHGDLDAAHRLEHKSILYEEALRVPLIVSHPGVASPGRVDDEHLVSVGLDLIPTLCDYASITPPPDLPGRSIRPLVEGRQVDSWRDHVVAESKNGNMVRTSRYKYNVYDTGRNREQLIDLDNDPGEMHNLVDSPAHAQTLAAHRELLDRASEQ